MTLAVFAAMSYEPYAAVDGQKQNHETHHTAYPDDSVGKHKDIEEIKEEQEHRYDKQHYTDLQKPTHQIDRRRSVLSNSRLIGLSFLIALEKGT